MALVKIESRRDYEIHVKTLVAKMPVSSKNKAVFRKIAMQCFDDGIAMNMNKLTVEVSE